MFVNPYGRCERRKQRTRRRTISPGEFVTAFGANLATSTLQAGAPYPMTLGGVTVTVNGISGTRFIWSSAGQINFLVPYAVTGTTASVSGKERHRDIQSR